MNQQTPSYIARICWNSQGWRFPTAEASNLEQRTYVTQTGFGHEEWLFDYSRMVGPYHYAFLQLVGRSRNALAGKSLEVLLYSINPNGQRVYIGEIAHCEVLDDAQGRVAVAEYSKRGWLTQMREEARAVGGNWRELRESADLFNVRFRPEHARLYGWPPPLAAKNDLVWSYGRYVLIAATQTTVREWRSRRGTQAAPMIHIVTRRGTSALTYDPTHKRMQSELLPLLQEQFGKRCVWLEQNYVDIEIRTPKRRILIEVKTEPDARENLRRALGQLLEYAYFVPGESIADPELIVIGPAPTTERLNTYLKTLRSKFNLLVRYVQFTCGGHLPSI